MVGGIGKLTAESNGEWRVESVDMFCALANSLDQTRKATPLTSPSGERKNGCGDLRLWNDEIDAIDAEKRVDGGAATVLFCVNKPVVFCRSHNRTRRHLWRLGALVEPICFGDVKRDFKSGCVPYASEPAMDHSCSSWMATINQPPADRLVHLARSARALQ